MMFYRQGELTDERERSKLYIQSQEVGDEYQKGLALCLLSFLFILTGIILFILYAVYNGLQNLSAANSLRLGGTFTVGIGVVFGLPGIAYIVLFYKEHKNKPSVDLTDATHLVSLANNVSDIDTPRLLQSAHKLVMKLELASQDSMQTTTKSLKNVSKDKPACQAEKLKSFSNFGRTGTVSNFELYRHKLLQNYLDVVLPKGLDEPGTEDEYELAPETRSTSQDSIRLSQFHNASSRQLTSTLLAANGKINLEITNLSKPNEEERDSNITLSDKSIANDVLDEDLIVNTND